MKKDFKKVLLMALFTSVILLFGGCKKSSLPELQVTEVAVETEVSVEETEDMPVLLDQPMEVVNRTSVGFTEMSDFFTPEFNAVSFESRNGEKKSKNNSSKDKNDVSENVIPGLRQLSKYKTSYSTEWPEFYAGTKEAAEEFADDEDSEDSDKAFVIESWGPQNSVVAENEKPTFYVSFSQPVHKLAALEAPTSKSDILSIVPKLDGVYRWYGTKMLAYECNEPADPAQVYTITVNENLKSLNGAVLQGETKFKTKAADLSVSSFYAGYIDDSNYDSGWGTGVKPPYDKRFYIRLNYPITVETLEDNLSVTINSKARSFKAEPDYDEDHFRWGGKLKYDKAAKKSNSFIVTIDGNIPFGTTVFVKFNRSSESYETLRSFHISEVDKYTASSSNGKQNPLYIRFNLPVDAATVPGNISFDFDFELTKDNYSVDGSTITVYNLPIQKRESHTVYIGNDLKDIYGQSFDNHVYRYSSRTNSTKNGYDFVVSAPPSYSRFLDYGVNIMEAQFPHKLLFEYQNINEGSKYVVSKTTNPLASDYDNNLIEGDYITVDPGKEDVRHFEEIELDPYLQNGFGFVKFQAAIKRQQYNSWKERWEETTDKNTMTVQVTDLGVTARVGVNKAVVLVTSLATGKPVQGAKVDLHGKIGRTAEDIDSVPFASATTDKNGLAVITYTEEQFNKFKTYFTYLSYTAPVVKVSKGDDKVIYQPSSHYTYEFGVSRGSYDYAVTPRQRTFMFVDRGLYRPGETVTFRGIDRDQTLGMLVVPSGSYTISVIENTWDGKTICDSIKGTLSESGGFYGSFKLPDDVTPGTYCIRYRRDSQKDYYGYEQILFTVAEFERVKFESSITIPEITYYGGDSINAEISASYLAGGSLSGADYSANWYKQPVTFTTDIPEAKNFTFGPRNYSSRNYYSDGSGKLGNTGTANAVCKTEKITDGSAYKYRISADITDLSNQRISTNSSVTVHPGLFYVGLKRSGNGFAEKGKKIDISYLLVGPDGKILTGVSKKAGAFEYKLTHTEWQFVNEQSVNSVYTRYKQVEVEDSKGKVDIKDSSGSFSITPAVSGWYTLTVSGSDVKQNHIETVLNFYVTGSGGYWHGDSENITLTASQNMYNPGDTAQILLQSPLPSGDYLITVEREGIFTQEIKHFASSTDVIEIPISQNYLPVVYVSVSSYSVRKGKPTHEYGEVDLDKPKGYYGVVPLHVNPYVKAFSVKIDCDKPTYRPGEDVEITLTATKGGAPFRNAELTLMAVDRGVLDLIDYHVSNPIDYFYADYNYLLSVYGGDSRALLMDPVTYSVKNLAGGDAESEDEEKEAKRKDFRPTAVFEPVLITDENGKAVCKFKMPDNLTTYRITAFGVNNDLFALQEEEVKVQNPVNVSVVKPRRLRERDTAETGVLITNLDKYGHQMTVSLEVAGTSKRLSDTGDGMAVMPGLASVDGVTERTVYVASGDSSVVYFDVAAESQGTVSLKFHIKSDILNEEIEDCIDIERTFVYETVATMGSINPEDTKNGEKVIIPGFAKYGRGDLEITLDATRLGLLGNGVNYVFDYPYGCLEQQTSRLYPLVAFDDYIDIFGLDNKVRDIKQVVKHYMKGIADSQLSSGGFPYWPGGNTDNFYVSLRIANIYQIAISRGYKKADLAIDFDALLRYITNNVARQKSDYMTAQACYIMAKEGRTGLDYLLTKLYEAREDQSLTNLAYMGMTYLEKGDADKAEVCSRLIRQYMVPGVRTVSFTKKNSRYYSSCWENDSAMQATVLKFFVRKNPNDNMVDLVLNTLMGNQTRGYWQNTVTTAQVLDSIYTYITERKLDNTDYRATAILDGKELMNASFKGASAKPKTLKFPFEEELLASMPRDKALDLGFSKKGEGYLFYTVAMTYALPDELQAARNEGLEITYEIRDFETDELMNPAGAATNELKLESGKMYKATIKLQSNKNRDYVALRAPIPSGAEVLDSTFVTTGDAVKSSSYGYSWGHWLDNKVIRDNEVQFFWDYFGTGSTTVDFTFRASRRGVYPVPPVQAECMYEPEVFGRTYGYLAEIR